MYQDWRRLSGLPFSSGEISKLMSRLLWKVWAVGPFGPNSNITTPIPVKDGTPVTPAWVSSNFMLCCSCGVHSIPCATQMFHTPKVLAGSRRSPVMSMTRLPDSGTFPGSASPMLVGSG